MITYGEYAATLIRKGYYVIPIKQGQKRPAIRDWTNPENYNPDPEKFAHCGIGIICGYGENPVYAVDMDITDESIAGAFSFDAPLRIGKAPKKMYVFRGTVAGERKKASNKYKGIGHVELWGFGEQFVAFGIHPITKAPYSWPHQSLLTVPAVDLPVLTADMVDDTLKAFEALAGAVGEIEEKKGQLSSGDRVDYDPTDPLMIKAPHGLTVEEMREMLEELDPDCGRDQWRNIGFALHYETKGSEEALELWDEWSAKGEKYKEGEPESYWKGFGKYAGEPITMAYIKKLVQQAGVTEGDIKRPDNFFQSADWSPARFSDDPPGIKMVVQNMIPKGIVGLVFSDGGAGKSTLMLDLLMRVSCGGELSGGDSYYPSFFCNAIEYGKSVFLTAEDPDHILNRRYIAIAEGMIKETDSGETPLSDIRHLIEKNLKIVSTFGHPMPLFMFKLTKLVPTKAFEQFYTYLKTIDNLQLIVIDTKTRFSPGEEEGNVAAASEISYYEFLAKETGATVLLLHHTNKTSRDGSQTGRQAFRGVTALFDNTRLSFYLRAVTSAEALNEGINQEELDKYFVLDNPKNNYIKKYKSLLIRRDGYLYSCRDLKPKLTKEQKTEKEEQTLADGLITFMQRSKQKGFLITDLNKYFRSAGASRKKGSNCLENLQSDGLIGCENTLYFLTEEGKKYNLEIEETNNY